MRSLAKENLTLIKGANRVLSTDDIEVLVRGIPKDYNAENASAFYTINNVSIAEYYARKISKMYGGVPTLNYYNFNLEEVAGFIKEAYFNELNSKSIRYVGENLAGILPANCPKRGSGMLPRELCHLCSVMDCERNADYIESILSEGGYYSLDEILLQLVDGRISDEEAILQINVRLHDAGFSTIPLQISLREKAIRLGLRFRYAHTIPLEG